MTDAVPIEEPVLPVPPAPEATAEVENASSETASVDGLAPAPDEGVAAPTEIDAASPEAPAEAAAPPADAPALPEIEYPIGSTRQAILDHFIDSEGDRSMSQIKAAMPTVLPATVEACVRREWEAGRLLRISPGIYRLAPAKPAEQPKSPKPPPPQPEPEAAWFYALERWAVDPASWNTEQFGPPPDQPNNIPPDIKARFNDRVRKRQERRREAEAAAAKRAAADFELRDKLIAATAGNVIRGPGLDDVSPIRAAMELVPLDQILSSIRYKTDRKLYPRNEPATSWGERRLLKAIAEDYCSSVIVPSLVAAWEAAGETPAPKAEESLPPVRHMPDDIDRSHHDSEHAPPGPHGLPKPPADRRQPSVRVGPKPDMSSTISPSPAASPLRGRCR